MASQTQTLPTEGTVPAEGTELYYRSVGSGTPLIMVHGGPGLGHYYLRPGMDALADRFRLVYYDQRGTGRTEVGDPDRITLGGGVEDLLAVIDGLGIERASLVGHSFGADLAALFASRHPTRVGSLVLANPGPPFEPGLKAIEAPVLVVHAEMDPIPEAFSRQLADTIPGARYAFLKGTAHFAYLED